MAKQSALMPESAVLSGALAYLGLIGVKADRHNVGCATNPNGQRIRFGKKGDPDIMGRLPGGRVLGIECKREGFDPSKLRGDKLAHFERQLAAMKAINDDGGVAFWIDDPAILHQVMPIILAGGSVVERGDDWEVVPKEEAS